MPKHVWGVNYAYQKSVSYSQYSIYKQCQYQWYLNYIKKLKIFKPSVHLTFGTSFHEILQEYIKVMYEDSAKKADELDLEAMLKARMYENYKQSIEENGGQHFISEKDFRDFTEDGVTILDFLKKKRSEYFNLKTTKLIGIEIPIEQYIVDEIPNVIMTGSIDLIFFNKNTETYEIYDIKTSTKGWNDNDKKDKNKISQLLLYKHFYSRALNVPIDKIEVRFFIVKRRPWISPDFPTKYVQEFIPAQGTKKVKDAVADFESFVKECFTTDNKYIDREYPKNLDGCKWCPFKDKPDICDRKDKKVLL
jgi:hypothetical protein